MAFDGAAAVEDGDGLALGVTGDDDEGVERMRSVSAATSLPRLVVVGRPEAVVVPSKGKVQRGSGA